MRDVARSIGQDQLSDEQRAQLVCLYDSSIVLATMLPQPNAAAAVARCKRIVKEIDTLLAEYNDPAVVAPDELADKLRRDRRDFVAEIEFFKQVTKPRNYHLAHFFDRCAGLYNSWTGKKPTATTTINNQGELHGDFLDFAIAVARAADKHSPEIKTLLKFPPSDVAFAQALKRRLRDQKQERERYLAERADLLARQSLAQGQIPH